MSADTDTIEDDERSAVADMIEGVKRVDALLSNADLEPRAERKDWASAKTKLEELRRAIEEEVAPFLEAALDEVEGTELGPKIRRRAAFLYGDAAAAFQASGDGIRAAELLAKAERWAADDEQKAELVAAQREPALFARLVLSRWLLGEQRFDEADREAKWVRRETKQAVLSDRARKVLRSPRPLRGGAPGLFTLNGFGTGLYGSRDEDAEGRYVATYCLCALFIPVFPLAAYRVQKVSATGYRFFAKEPLSSFARGYQAFVGLSIALAIAGTSISSYLESPERRAALALEEAKGRESAGEDAAALEGYRRIVDGFSPSDSSVKQAASGIARLAAKDVPSPCTALSIEAARGAANAYLELPGEVRDAAPAGDLTKKLEDCAGEIGDAELEQARASLRMLEMASDVAKRGPDASRVEQRRDAARRALAAKLAGSRPYAALAQLSSLEDAESVAAAKQIVFALGEGPSLWLEAEAHIEKWARNARHVNDGEAANQAETKLGAARAAHQESAAVLAAAVDKEIERAAAAHPADQELAVALAAAKRSHGDAKGAISLLAKLGPPGRLTAEAQELLANCHADTGDLAKGDEILSALVDERLPAFLEAQQAYLPAAEEVRMRYAARLKRGDLPADLDQRLSGITEESKKIEEAQEWLEEKVRGDAKVANLLGEYLRHGSIMGASLSLGMIKLRRAAEAQGDERQRLLAGAERAFLSMARSAAAGSPVYHLGLGQVYYRLGKSKEGESELSGVLERGEPNLSIAVARTYRELGLYADARKVARDLYETTKDERARYTAADLLAHLASEIEEEEEWLKKSDPNEPSVRVGLDRVAGERLIREGKLAEADQKLKRCVEYFDRNARTSAVAANNAATETLRRYGASGDPAHLQAAAAYLETAVKLEPDNALVLGNLAAALAHLGYVTVLSKWVDTRLLILDHSSAQSLASSMADGAFGAEVLEALRKDPSYQRSLEVSRKQQVLAPQMLDAYYAQLAWLAWNHDVKGLEDLQKLVDLLPASADVSGDIRAKWLSGERDPMMLRQRKDGVAAARRQIERTKGAAKATQAVAQLALSDALQGLAFFERDPATLDEMVASARKARSSWPEGISRADLSGALYAAAYYRAFPASPALQKSWEEGRRKHSTLVLGYLAAAGEGGAAALSALRKEPALAEAIALQKETVAASPAMNHYLMARVSGNDELQQAAMKAFDSHETELRYALAAKLQPSDEDAQLLLKLFRSRGASH